MSKQVFYKFTCDESGDEVLIEASEADKLPDGIPLGWGVYRDDTKKEFYFSSKANWDRFWEKGEAELKKSKTPKSFK